MTPWSLTKHFIMDLDLICHRSYSMGARSTWTDSRTSPVQSQLIKSHQIHYTQNRTRNLILYPPCLDRWGDIVGRVIFTSLNWYTDNVSIQNLFSKCDLVNKSKMIVRSCLYFKKIFLSFGLFHTLSQGVSKEDTSFGVGFEFVCCIRSQLRIA